uniref:POP4 domain-containing protein n=1 Tax=Meloidogyne hapla TaxID=6305 RepID=A0A1I8B7V0_MELHA
MLKAQRYNKARFDGQKIYNTPLCFEFVWTSATVCEMCSADVKGVKLFEKIETCGCYGFECVLGASFTLMGDALCAVVADRKNKRADLKVKGGAEAAGLRLLARGDALNIKKCFVVIEDECIVATTDVASVCILNKSKEIGNVLTTPKRRKDGKAEGEGM